MGNETPKEIQVLIADDHPIFRDGFKLLLKKLKVHRVFLAGEAGDGRTLVEMTSRLLPQLVITDIQMPEMDGIEATRQIKKMHPSLPVMALSMFNEEGLVMDMLEAGASGYLLKNTSHEELYRAIQTIMQGGVYFAPETAVHLHGRIQQSGRANEQIKPVHLSHRELEIIRLICKGMINKEMAAALHLSIRTVESYRENIYEKTHTRSAVELAIYAIRRRIVDLGGI